MNDNTGFDDYVRKQEDKKGILKEIGKNMTNFFVVKLTLTSFSRVGDRMDLISCCAKHTRVFLCMDKNTQNVFYFLIKISVNHILLNLH